MSNFVQTGRNIVAIGRNFAEHAKELKNAVPTRPFYFLKPTSSYLPYSARAAPIILPAGCDVHHEVELAVVMGAKAKNVKPSEAANAIAGYALALDMTARNLQNEAKKAGLPWAIAKGYDTFTPVGSFIPRTRIQNPQNVQLTLKVNGNVRQSGNTSSMIFGVYDLISFVSSIMTLNEGDIILTGTPEGVGPVVNGDRIQAELAVDGNVLDSIEFMCKDAPKASL